MLCLYIFPQGVDAPELRLSGDRHAEPGIVQIGADIQQIGPFAEEQKLMLGILPDLSENRFPPLRFPARQVAHARQQEILRARFVHHPQLSGEEFRLGKVVDHVIPLHIVSRVAVRAAHGAADHQVHVLDQILDAYAHGFSFSSRFRCIRCRYSSNCRISSSVKPL